MASARRTGTGISGFDSFTRPRWAADGSAIYYQWDSAIANADRGINRLDLHTMHITTVVRYGTAGMGAPSEFDVSRSGRLAVEDYVNGGPPYTTGVRLISPKGASKLLLVPKHFGSSQALCNIARTSCAAVGYPSWSPDGSTLAFAGDGVFLFSLRTQTFHRIVSGSEGEISSVGWAPDGSEITYARDQSGSSTVWIVSKRTGHTERLVSGSSPDWGASPR